MIHELAHERTTLHGHFSRDLPPVATIEPGDSVVFSCPNAGWRVAGGEPFEPRGAHGRNEDRGPRAE